MQTEVKTPVAWGKLQKKTDILGLKIIERAFNETSFVGFIENVLVLYFQQIKNDLVYG